MDGPDILAIARRELSSSFAEFQPPSLNPLSVSPWVAMSLLQKAIRRRHKGLALRAAATLLHESPERLWCRLRCIAFEDIGVADLNAVALVTAALAGKKFRGGVGGEWPIASLLVTRMADAFNDLRGTAVTRLALAGCTEAEIAVITGHSHRDVRSILDARYLHRDPALAESAIRKLETRIKSPK